MGPGNRPDPIYIYLYIYIYLFIYIVNPPNSEEFQVVTSEGAEGGGSGSGGQTGATDRTATSAEADGCNTNPGAGGSGSRSCSACSKARTGSWSLFRVRLTVVWYCVSQHFLVSVTVVYIHTSTIIYICIYTYYYRQEHHFSFSTIFHIYDYKRHTYLALLKSGLWGWEIQSLQTSKIRWNPLNEAGLTCIDLA